MKHVIIYTLNYLSRRLMCCEENELFHSKYRAYIFNTYKTVNYIFNLPEMKKKASFCSSSNFPRVPFHMFSYAAPPPYVLISPPACTLVLSLGRLAILYTALKGCNINQGFARN